MKHHIKLAKLLTLGALLGVGAVHAQTMQPISTSAAVLGHPEVAVVHDDHDHGTLGGFTGGFELLYLKPHFGGNQAYLVHADNGTVDQHFTTDFKHDYDLAPRLWVGFGRPDEVGVRGRAFNFNDDADRLTIGDGVGPGAGTANLLVQTAAPGGLGFYSTGNNAIPTVLTFDSTLKLKAYDLEATWMGDNGRAHWMLSGGVRYAEADQTFFATERQTAGPGQLTSIINSRKHFDGVGPTVGAETRVGIGDGGLSAYGNGRASIVFGDSDQNVTAGVIPTGARAAFSNNFSSQDAMPIGELELGLEWRKEKAGRSFFVQGGVTAQTWFGAGNATNTEDPAPRAAVGGGTVNRQGDVDQASSDADISLVGFKFAGGIKF